MATAAGSPGVHHLYDAALLANLTVTERHNHMFTVGYVPLGMDAAVSWDRYAT